MASGLYVTMRFELAPIFGLAFCQMVTRKAGLDINNNEPMAS